MKTGIIDYFGQSSKGISSDAPSSLSKDKITLKNSTKIEPSNSPQCEDSRLNGKENSKTKMKGKDKKLSDNTGESPSGSSQKKRTQKKKKSLSTKKLISEHNLDQPCVSNRKETGIEDSQPVGFPLKIKLKSKQLHDSECFIEEFSSPERVYNDMKSSDLKSPQGTLLQYFTSQKNPCPGQQDIDPKERAHRDITDFFSSSKLKEVSPISSIEIGIKNKGVVDDSVVKEVVDEKLSSKSKNVKKKKRKSPSLAAKQKDSKGPVQTDPLVETSMELKDESRKANSRSRVKSKPVKRSLSLPKSEASNNKPSIQMEEKTVEHGDETVKQSMSNNLKNILSKASSIKASDSKSSFDGERLSTTSKKRKRDEEDEREGFVEDKLSKPICDESPVKSRKRFSKNNHVGCDSDDETSNKLIEQKPPKSTLNTDINCDSVDCGPDVPSKGEDTKRSSLMNYFSKVSKEELLAKEEKVEYKVQALVHSPPTTPSKKCKRRSINSLPGRTSSLTKKKGNIMKANLKENLNAIDVIIVDEPKGPDVTCKDQNSHKGSGTRQVRASKLSTKSQKICTSPQKKNSDSTNASVIHSLNDKEANASPGMEFSQSVSSENAINAVKCVSIVNEDSLAIPLTVRQEKFSPDSPPDTLQNWKLRVCLTPGSLPTTQGTLLEEESDCDEIFLCRRKKKRKLTKQNNCNPSNDETQKEILAIAEQEQSSSPDVVFEKESGPSVKIAPLFTRKAEVQARQLFLQSGVPDQIKRALETQVSLEEQEAEIFPTKSHIQQINDKDWVWNLSPVALCVKSEDTVNTLAIPCNFSLTEMMGCCNIREEVADIMNASCKGPEMRTVYGLPMNIVKPILRSIKQESPDFKVVSIFKSLRSKLREEEIGKAAALSAASEIQRPRRKSSNRKSLHSKDSFSLPMYRAQVWTEKYRPVSASEIVGNSESVQQLKRWLEAWRKASEDASRQNVKADVRHKNRRKDLIDDEDFLVSDNSSEGGQSNLPIGVALLCGPNGSGKTCSVYALAKDLGYKVLEVNASEKRNGKFVLSKLSEATQSHQVQQSKCAEQGFAALFGSNLKSVKNNKKKSTATPKSVKQTDDEKTKKMSLILFEDVDVVFDEEDEGFLSAISSLVSTSKRPVILTTTDPESPTISRFMNSASLILEYSCPWNTLSTWLQIVSVLEGVYVAPDAVKDLVLLCKGDFRRALLQMQLWVTSGGNNLHMPPLMFPQNRHKSNKGAKYESFDYDLDDMNDDETTTNEDMDSMAAIPANFDCISPMLGLSGEKQIHGGSEDNKNKNNFVKIPFPLNLGSYWWNIPPMLCLKQIVHAPLPVVKEFVSNSGPRRMLDDSFVASFCTEDGDMNDCGSNEDSNGRCSQGTTDVEIEKEENTASYIKKSDENSHTYRSCCSQKEMFAVTFQMLCISSVDVISAPYQLGIPSNMEPISRFPHATLKDSLSLVKFEEENCSYVSKSTSDKICHWLAEQSLMATKNCLDAEGSCLHSCYNPCLPNEEELRWRDLHVETERAALAAVPLCMQVERQAISTDYIPTLRILCRLERNRSIINTKRRNRFYHYLRSIGLNLTDTQLEILCQTMSAEFNFDF